MRTRRSDARRGQAALWLVPVLLLVAVGAWYLANMVQENARLKSELAAKPGGTAAPAARPAAPAAPAAPVTSSGPVVGGRSLDEDHQKAMRQVLEGEQGATKRAWIQVQAGDKEAAALGEQLSGVFKAAGWTVSSSLVTGMTLKPGIFMFEAEEASPDYVATARESLKAAGLEAMNAGGYRAFYEEKKQANPKWVGIELGADQEYAIVIGPKPAG